MNRYEEIEQRIGAIGDEVKRDDADLDKLERELKELTEEREAILKHVEQRKALLKQVETEGKVIHRFGEDSRKEERTFDASSPEYRSAFLKTLAKNHKTGEMRLGELTEVEQRAFTYMTATTTAVLPTQMSTKIWDIIGERYALLGHVAKSTFKNIYQFDQATVIAGGDAAVTNQNTANSDDLQITINPVTLSGVEIRADVVISRKMQIQSMDGFEDYLVRKVGERIGVKMNKQLFSDIVADRLEANLVEVTGTLAESDFREALGVLKGGFDCRIYASQSTIWNNIAGVQDLNGRPYFIADTVADDPTMQGRIFGKKVYLDDTVDDGTIHLVYVDCVEANLFQDVEILSDVDAKTHAMTYGGLAIFEAALGDTRGLATISISESS